MAAPKKVTKEEILRAASQLLRESGNAAVNARSIAKYLKCSTQPIYAAFSGMQEVKTELLKVAENLYGESVKRYLSHGAYKPYEAYGLGFVSFAREEKQMFRYLYMRTRCGEKRIDDVHMPQILAILQNEYGYGMETAEKFHADMSVYSYGLAILANTGFAEFSDEEILQNLRREFIALTGVYGTPKRKQSAEKS